MMQDLSVPQPKRRDWSGVTMRRYNRFADLWASIALDALQFIKPFPEIGKLMLASPALFGLFRRVARRLYKPLLTL